MADIALRFAIHGPTASLVADVEALLRGGAPAGEPFLARPKGPVCVLERGLPPRAHGLIYVTSALGDPSLDRQTVAAIEDHYGDDLPLAAVVVADLELPDARSRAALAGDLCAFGRAPLFRLRLPEVRAGRSLLQVTRWAEASRVSERLWVGSCFAFLADPEDQASVRPLFEPLVEVPGGRVVPKPLPRLRLASLTSDKSVYQEGRDEVHLLAVEVLAPRAQRTLVLHRNGQEYQRVPFVLDDQGVFAASLPGLPGGDYRVELQGGEGEAEAVELLVADYALSALSAQLLERSLEGDRLSFALALEAFGVPVEGPVTVTLREGERAVAEVQVLAAGGRCRGQLTVSGEGPHDLALSLASDPQATAVVPLPGTDSAGRASTRIGTLGGESTATLVPGDATTEARGLHLRRSTSGDGPVSLEVLHTRVARLTVRADDLEELTAVLWDPATGASRAEHLRSPAAGATLELAVPDPCALLCVGAFQAGRPLEAWTHLVTPSEVGLELVAPDAATPGREAVVRVRAGTAEEPATVYLLVKDERLTGPTPASRLAAGLKRHLERTAASLARGPEPLHGSMSEGVDDALPVLDRLAGWILNESNPPDPPEPTASTSSRPWLGARRWSPTEAQPTKEREGPRPLVGGVRTPSPGDRPAPTIVVPPAKPAPGTRRIVVGGVKVDRDPDDDGDEDPGLLQRMWDAVSDWFDGDD